MDDNGRFMGGCGWVVFATILAWLVLAAVGSILLGYLKTRL